MAIKKDLSIKYLGVECLNPFFLSSSPVCANYEMVAKAYKEGWAGCFFKTVGPYAMDECSPRFDNVSKEGTPWIGFKNMEQVSQHTPEENFEAMAKLNHDFPEHITVASIMGSNVEEWKKLATMAEQCGAKLIEGNFSCPQMATNAMGSDVGTNPELLFKYSQAVASVTKIPFIAKMTPNCTEMVSLAKKAIEGGAKSVSAINTIKSITNIDFENMTAMPVVNGKSSISGYSGAAIKPIALRFCAQLLQGIEGLELSGIGGIETWRDAAEYLVLGCRNLQVTTSVMQYGYRIVEDMQNGLMHFMAERGYNKLDDFVGKAIDNIIPAENLNRDFMLLPKFDDKKCIGCGRCYVSCYDGGHQALKWNEEDRRPELIKDKCVGCHLCLNVCPITNCITTGEITWKKARKPVDVTYKKDYSSLGL